MTQVSDIVKDTGVGITQSAWLFVPPQCNEVQTCPCYSCESEWLCVTVCCNAIGCTV